MFRLPIIVLTSFLSLPSPAVKTIERAWLVNGAGLLRTLLPPQSSVIVSLPDPIGVSDQLTGEQAALLFDRVFTLYRTSEFYPDERVFGAAGREGVIVKASWSFRGAGGPPQRFLMYFALVPERILSDPDDPGIGEIVWRIAEIRAERL